jgi:hypothetical protein
MTKTISDLSPATPVFTMRTSYFNPEAPVFQRIRSGSNKRFEFLSLVTELQISILRHVIPRPGRPITVRSHDIHKLYILRLAFCSRKSRDLAYTIYYGENTFSFANDLFYNLMLGRPAHVFYYPDLTVCYYLRNVELKIKIRCTLRKIHSLLDDPSMVDLRVLMRPVTSLAGSTPSEIAEGTAWQNHMCSLSTFRVTMNFKDILDPRMKRVIENVGTTVSIPIKPRVLKLRVNA